MSGDSIQARSARLSSAQRALLARRINGSRNEPAQSWTIPRRVNSGVAPLSLAQEGLWLLHQHSPDSAAYNIFAALRLRGALDSHALEAALSEMVRRHEILRTSFQLIDEVPQQVVAPAEPLLLPNEDFSHLAGMEQDSAVSAWSRRQGSRPFRLDADRLFRVCLIRLGDDEHSLFLAVHHIVCDGWSLGLMAQELLTIYDALAHGRPISLPALPIQYGDYAAWQRSHVRPSDLDQKAAQWKERLADTALLLEFPTDRPRPPVRSFSGRDIPLKVPILLVKELSLFLKQNRVTLFMTLLAALGLLLYRHSGNPVPLIGSPIATRPSRELEGLIGLFVNTLVFRVDLRGDPTVTELMDRVKNEAIRVYEDRELSFERLVGALQIPRDQSHSPVFQVSLALQPKPVAPRRIGELEVSQNAGIFDAVKYDLSLSMIEAESGHIAGRLEYATDLFDRSTVVGLAEHYLRLLEEMIAKPDRRLSDLSLLGEADRLERVAARNAIAPGNAFEPFTRGEIEQSLPARFAAQVARSPAALAIADDQVVWSYRELNRQANGIALAVLEQTGRGPGCIGLLFEPGATMVAAMVGVLKAGKSYVPLDPLHPVERLQFIVGDAALAAIVCGSGMSELAQTCGAVPIATAMLSASDQEPAVHRPPDMPTYLLYTSGTSGQPKGVMQSDRNILHFMAAYTNALHLCRADRVSLFASYSFDASVMDIYGALLNGASLHVCDPRRSGLEGLSTWLEQRAITVWHSTPTLYRLAAPACSARALSTVRLVVLGGEEATPADLALLRDRFGPSCLLVNGFGPTESTLALQYFCGLQTEPGPTRLPIGYPVEGTRIVLLDRSGAPTDLVGEIGILSAHTAFGYHKRPGLTAERFVPSPFGDGERLYRTGDLGRFRATGELEYLGRIDHQVKLRGYRIELGEIEAALRSQAGVFDAVVVARADDGGETRLAAYVAGAAGLDAEGLRAGLKQRLPDYMVPSVFAVLEALPLTPNGKVDRSALPPPKWHLPSAAYTAPRSPAEEVLAAIWCEVLGRDQVGIDDNFFDLGGHSLLLVRVHARLSARLGGPMPITALFQYPTIRSLSDHIAGSRESDAHMRTSRERGRARKHSRAKRNAISAFSSRDL